MSRLGAIPLAAAYRRIFVVLLLSGFCINAYFLRTQWWGLAKGYADFTIFYSAANMVRSGQGRDLYNERAQYFAQRAAAPDVRIRSMALPYNHPPFEALLFVPLSYLPYLPAYLLWTAANVGFLFAAIWLLRPNGLSIVPLVVLFAAALIFFPVFITLFQGQDLILLLLIVSATYASIKRENDFFAGCILCLGLFRPELVLPIALLIVLNRGKRFAAGFLVAAAGLILISAAVVGPETLLAYPAYVWHMERLHGHGSIIPADMPNLHGLISLFVRNQTATMIAIVVASATVLAISAWRIRWPEIAGNTERMFCLATLCSLLISFHALKHDLALLVIPVMFACAEWNGPPSTPSRELLLWPVLFFFCTPILIFLLLGLEKFCLVALVLIAWFWGVSTATPPRQEQLRSSGEPA